MECSGGLGVLGEARMTASRRWRSVAADNEEVVGDGVSELFRPYELTERTRVAQRSSWAGQRSEGEAVAVAAASGGDGSVRLREGERAEEGRRHGRE